MSSYDRGRNMPDLPPLLLSNRPAPYVRHLPSTEKEFAPYIDPEPVRPRDTPGAAFTFTCDAGHCDAPTVAVVRGVEGAWLSMCKKHTVEEMAAL